MSRFATKALHEFFVTFFKPTMITFSNSYFSDLNWIWIVLVYLPKHTTVFSTQTTANIVYTSKRLCFQVLSQRFPLSQLSNFVSNHAGKTGITILFYLNNCMREKQVSSLEFITHIRGSASIHMANGGNVNPHTTQVGLYPPAQNGPHGWAWQYCKTQP